ncbi:PIG-L family deacetylase [Legionella sp. CNM-4043-24]|uniref:PIG-L family deacetylase n=1 Tax=Legionella sp. CNM-4043-24 TaxID=3421646 RepID=UPI00403AA7AE
MNTPSCKILLIEDDLAVAGIITGWLENLASLTHCLNASEAYRLINEEYWDLVITDLSQSQINDLDVTDFVKKNTPQTSVLIVTSDQKIHFIITAMQNHADGLMFKPLEKTEFITKVFELAEAAKTRREKEKKVILAIGSHPDDVEVGCSGSLLLHRSKGDALNILTLSAGESGGNPEVRKTESRLAANILGARLFMGSLSDKGISEATKTIELIESVVEQCKPTHVYTHSLHDSHQDHRNAYLATITACRKIPNIYCYLSPSTTIDFKPALYVDINEFIKEKLQLIALFKSQSDHRPYLQADLVKATARYWGRYSNYNLVEPMEVIRQQYQ